MIPAPSRLDAARVAGVLLVPLVILVAFVANQARRSGATATETEAVSAPPAVVPPLGRTVVFIIDSLREQNGRDPGLMPELAALNAAARHGLLRTCAANFTLPCLLTAFEGRESPFVTALSNFSGSAEVTPSWFEALAARGLRMALIGDHTLPALYGRYFQTVMDYEETPLSAYERDRWAMDAANRLLDAGETDVLVLHIVGTDKVAHAELPASPDYQRLFRDADAMVGQLARRLDPERDTLLVFGDHGHGPEGHHDRFAWYAMRGPHIVPGEHTFEQVDLLYLLARVHGVPVSKIYEGAFHWSARANDPLDGAWRAAQAAAWGLPDGESATLDAAVAAAAEVRALGPTKDAIAFAPWGLTLVLALGIGLRAAASGRAPPPGHLRLSGLAVAILVFTGPWLVWVVAMLHVWLLRRSLRAHPPTPGPMLAALAVLGATGVGALVPWIAETFHVRSGGTATVLTWHVYTVVVPLILAYFLAGPVTPPPASPRRRLGHALLAPPLVGFLLLGPGVYYYGSAQHVFHTLFAAVLLAALVLRDGSSAPPGEPPPLTGRFRALAFLALLPGVLHLRVSAGGWEWHTLLHSDLRSFPLPLSVALAALVPPILAALAPEHARWRAFALGSVITLLGWPFHMALDVPPERIIGLFYVSVSVAAGLRLVRGAPWLRWTVFALGLFVALWALSSGFYLKNLALDFALKALGPHFTRESELALAAAGVVGLRYVLLVLPVILAASAVLGPGRYAVVARGAVMLLLLRLVCLSVQFATVRIVEEEKSSELILQECVGVAWLALVVGAGLVVPATLSWLREWWMGRDRVSPPPAHV